MPIHLEYSLPQFEQNHTVFAFVAILFRFVLTAKIQKKDIVPTDKILYHITDHLGSVRVVKDGTGAVLQRFDYYLFGSVNGSLSSSTDPSQPSLRYRFSGKEIAGQNVDASLVASALAGSPAAAAGTPYLDFGARLYDPRSASWLSQDPLAEKYYHISP